MMILIVDKCSAKNKSAWRNLGSNLRMDRSFAISKRHPLRYPECHLCVRHCTKMMSMMLNRVASELQHSCLGGNLSVHHSTTLAPYLEKKLVMSSMCETSSTAVRLVHSKVFKPSVRKLYFQCSSSHCFATITLRPRMMYVLRSVRSPSA